MNEYEMLRAGIENNYKAILQYNCVLYTAAAAILAYAIQSDNYLICLIPYLAIIPLYLLCQDLHRGVCNLATYMFVFLEGKEYHWERRHHKYDRDYVQNETGNAIVHLPGNIFLQYYFISLACSAAAVYKALTRETDSVHKWIQTVAIMLFTAAVLAFMVYTKTDYTKTRENMIGIWTAIKEEEEREARAKQKAHTETP